MNAYDFFRHPILIVSATAITVIFALGAAGLFLLSGEPQFTGGCWGRYQSELFTFKVGPWVTAVSGLLLLSYGAVFLVTAFFDWRSQSKPA